MMEFGFMNRILKMIQEKDLLKSRRRFEYVSSQMDGESSKRNHKRCSCDSNSLIQVDLFGDTLNDHLFYISP